MYFKRQSVICNKNYLMRSKRENKTDVQNIQIAFVFSYSFGSRKKRLVCSKVFQKIYFQAKTFQ